MGKTILSMLLVFMAGFGFSENINLKIHHWEANNTLPPNPITNISQNSIGYILLECTDGVYRFNGKTSDFSKHTVLKKASSGRLSLNGNILLLNGIPIPGFINGYLELTNRDIWVAGQLGIGIVDTLTNTINWQNKPGELPIQNCFNLLEAPDGKLWFSMPLNGIGFYEPQSGRIFTLKNINDFAMFPDGHRIFSELLDYDITSLFFDNGGSLWISTRNRGLFKISFTPQPYQFFRFEYKQESELAHRDISFPLATKSGDVWISTWGGGINIWEKQELELTTPHFKGIPVLLKNKKPIPDMRIFPLLEDAKLNIWFGTESGGLFRLIANNRFNKQYNYDVFNIANGVLPNDSVTTLCKGTNNDIWCGTRSGLVHISEELYSRTEFEELDNPNLFKNASISMVKITSNKRMWIALRNGLLYLWDLRANKILLFKPDENINRGIFLNHALVNEIDWFVGTNGIYYYDQALNQIIPFKNNEQLPARQVESLLADNRGKLWIGSSSGLCKIDPLSEELTCFSLPGGRMGSSFTQGASKDKNGYLYFGSRYGFYRFHPDNLEYQPTQTPIVFTQFSISGNNYSIDSLAQTKMWQANEDEKDFIKLKYNQNTITVDYLNLNYSTENPTVFEIFLEGRDVDWMETSDTRRTWSALSPGSYVFQVKEKGRSNLSEIRFEIEQVWWTTTPAFIAYFVFMALLFVISYRTITIRAKQKEKQRQKEKFDQLRFRFFLNISHEIRTPLTLIKGAIDRLVDNNDQKENRELVRIKKNTSRLIRMVNEVLDLKKIENTQVEVKSTYFNLKDFLESTVDAFRLREDKCKIELAVPEAPVWINSSRDLLETILYNLLSNAIKFSPEKSVIKAVLLVDGNNCKISVQDFGKGIDKKEHGQIFKRFYKSEGNDKYGAGIGLSLVHEFVQLLNGEIELDSLPGIGSTFRVVLPFEEELSKLKLQNVDSREKPILLVVDDQPDIRSFVKEIFEDSFSCLEAKNGKVALDLISNVAVEFVISDVMMPEMNGFELCQQLKGNIKTSHIPLILLTAKTDLDAELKATECSADAFVTKPFNEKLLRLKVEKIIEVRKQLWERFKDADSDLQPELDISPLDSEFIKKLEKGIVGELDNSEFGVEELAQVVSLSSSGLYRKMKALTGQSPVEFIRNYRLKEAAQFLRESDRSVTEISDLCGFGTQKYFSRCFKEYFSISPLNYRKK